MKKFIPQKNLPSDFVFKSQFLGGVIIVYAGRIENDPKKPFEIKTVLQYVDFYNPYNKYGINVSYFEMSNEEIKEKFKSGEFYMIEENEWKKIKNYLSRNLSNPEHPRNFIGTVKELKNEELRDLESLVDDE